MTVRASKNNHGQNHFKIYTDGGYFEKQDLGGWGFVVFHNDQELYRDSGWKKQTSSLEMELLAAQKALQALQAFQEIQNQNSLKSINPITLFTDSKILIEGLTLKYPIWCQNEWRVKSGKTVIYKPLWQALDALSKQLSVELCWVKGHNGNHGNSVADALAREAILNSQF